VFTNIALLLRDATDCEKGTVMCRGQVGTRKRSFESLARVISADNKKQNRKWTRHEDGGGNSKTEDSEQMLCVCELGEEQKMEQ